MLIIFNSGQISFTNIVTNINFGIQQKKKIRDFKVIKGLNLIVRLNEKQTLTESLLLHRSPRVSTEYLNFWGRKSYYRDINLYFIYDKQYKQWFTSGPDFFNETICEKLINKNFNLTALGKKIIIPKRKETAMQLVMWIKGELWVKIDTI